MALLKHSLILFILLIQIAFGVSYNEEFQVNTYTQGDQNNQNITALSNGGFVICWQSEAQDGSGDGIYAQIFSVSGNKLGDEILVNTFTNNDQRNTISASISDDKFVICWESSDQDGSGYGLFAQIFSNAGLNIGEEFQVNTYTAKGQYNPQILALSENKFIICWESDRQDGSGYGIYAQVFNDSCEKIGHETQVNTYAEENQLEPEIALFPDGKFIICWRSNNQDGNGTGIFAQIFSNSGEKIGNEFQANTYTYCDQRDQNIVILSDGNFVICWDSNGQDGSGWGIYAQVFNSSGEKIGDEIQVNTFTNIYQIKPEISALSDGKFVICWESSHQDGDASGVFGQVFSGDGERIGEEFQVNTYIRYTQYHPKTLALPNGNFIICWESNGQDGSDYGIFAQIFTNTGVKIGEEFRINTQTERNQYHPQITLLSDGNFAICWESYYQDGSGYGVYAKYHLTDPISYTLAEFKTCSPGPEETIYTLLPSFEWYEASDIHVNFPWEITYDLCLSETDDFASPFVYTNIIDTTYTIPDELKRNQIYYWKVLAHTWEGDSLWSSDVGGFFVSATAAIDDDEMSIPSQFILHCCYPNPFNATTTIRYDLPENRNVKVSIYNSLGKKVDVLVNEFQQAGSYKYSWTANNLPSGIYFISVEADNFSDVSKCVLLK